MVSPVSGCNLVFFLKKQEYSQSTVLLDSDTVSILDAYWLTDADEINYFGHLIPNFDT